MGFEAFSKSFLGAAGSLGYGFLNVEAEHVVNMYMHTSFGLFVFC